VKLQPEWLEFLGLLRRHGVRYLMVGGLAVAVHGRERYTKDLDVLVQMSEANARRLGGALADFGFIRSARSWRRLTRPYQILTLGREPVRIDILTSIAGVSFETAWRRRARVKITGGEIQVIGLAELRINKAATGRAIDKLDLALLDELAPTRRPTRAAARSPRKRRPAAAASSRTRGTRRR
jgi:predicted nucleotidyltransferase